MSNITEYTVSIRVPIPETVIGALKQEKERFVAAYGSSYKSEPHITVYLDRYALEGFPKLLSDLRELPLQPFEITLLRPEMRAEEERHRNLYVVDVSNKERLQELYEKVLRVAVRYQSPLLREKTQKRLDEGSMSEAEREKMMLDRATGVPQSFDPHITLGEIGFGKPQPEFADVEKNLQHIVGTIVPVSSLVVFFHGKEEGAPHAKLIEEVTIPFHH